MNPTPAHGVNLRDSRQPLLVCGFGVDLNATRFDALLERNRQLQHAVVVCRGDLVEIEKLRHGEGLFIASILAARVSGRLDTNRNVVADNLEINVTRIDPRKGDVNSPRIVIGANLERRRCGKLPMSAGTTFIRRRAHRSTAVSGTRVAAYGPEVQQMAKRKAAAKRTLIEPKRGGKRFVRRSATGKFNESDQVSGSLRSDRRKKAKTKAKRGQGDKGDR